MKSLKLLFCMVFFATLHFHGYAALTPSTVVLLPKIQEHTKAKKPNKEQLKIAQMKWFTSLSVKDYEKLSGKKLNFFARVSFKMSQQRMQKMIKHYDWGEPSTLSKISWFGKGFVLGPIGVLLAYLFLRDEDRELIKWAWFGFAGLAVFAGILLLTI